MEDENDKFGLCPYFTMQKLFAGKWSLLIMHFLSRKKYRFGELQRELGDITQTTLTKQLRYMEEKGLIVRTVYNTIPPKVEYSLSEIGCRFSKVNAALQKFGLDYIEFLSAKEEH